MQNKSFTFIFGFTFILFALLGCENKKGAFIKSYISQNSHQKTLEKLIQTIKSQELRLFYTIDHSANAKDVNMTLKAKNVVIFGNPSMGTKLMKCNPSMGLDLPLRILVSSNYEGITRLSYTNPEYWSLKHNIKDKKCLNIITKAKMALADLVEKAGTK